MLVLCLSVLLMTVLEYTSGSGYFEIQITAIQNPRGEVLNGTCCDGLRNLNGSCSDECDTFFRVCLKEYQSRVTFDGSCTFGNKTSPILGGNTFTYPSDYNRTRLKLPFDFAWTVRFNKFILPLIFSNFLTLIVILYTFLSSFMLLDKTRRTSLLCMYCYYYIYVNALSKVLAGFKQA